VIRWAEPVTSGIPISPELRGSDWALFEDGVEIPVQAQEAPGQLVPWVLLDFQSSVAVNGTKTYILKNQTPTVTAPDAIIRSTVGSTTTVTNGPLRVTLNSSTFNGIDELWFDANGDRVYAPSEQRIFSTSNDNLAVVDAGTGQTLLGRGTPTSFSWETQGPIRSTLRVEGTFQNAGSTVLGYTLRLTFFAGRTDIKMEYLLQNSHSTREQYVKVSSAKLTFGTPETITRLPRQGIPLWAHMTGSGIALDVVPESFEFSTAYNPNATPPVARVSTLADTESNGGIIIGDLSYLGAEAVVDFATILTPQNASRLEQSWLRPLFAKAPGEWYSTQGAFGLSTFGTYEDEQSAYQAWGWTFPNPSNNGSAAHALPPTTSYFPSWSNLDSTNGAEADELWQQGVMYARVGLQNYKDRLDAYADYTKWQWAYRSDKFQHVGNSYWDGPHATARTPILQPTLTSIDSDYIQHDIKNGKAGPSHLWAGGLIDYYYLTGDQDALLAAVDVAEQCKNYYDWRTPGTSDAAIGDSPRSYARCWMNFIRVWEATNDSQWLDMVTHLRQMFLLSTLYDSRGFYATSTCSLGASYCSRFPNGKYLAPFQMGNTAQVMYYDWITFGNTSVRQRLIAMASFANTHGFDPTTGATGDYIVVDSPTAGAVTHVSYADFRGTGSGVPFQAASSASFIDTLAIGYRLIGNNPYLLTAKALWAQASKRSGTNPYDPVAIQSNYVGRFMNSLQGRDPDALLFPDGGDLTTVSLFFRHAYQVDVTQPSTTSNLRGL